MSSDIGEENGTVHNGKNCGGSKGSGEVQKDLVA